MVNRTEGMVVAEDSFQHRCQALAGIATDSACDAEALIGLLQQFRPSGEGLERLFDHLPMGEALQDRLRQLYRIAGDPARPGGGQDAYFIVRNPPAMAPDRAASCAEQWVEAIVALASETGDDEIAQRLTPRPSIRVLQGIAPKQTRGDLQMFPLYRAIKKQAAELSARLPAAHAAVQLLRPAYYYAACDWSLRDYLLWPAYDSGSKLDDPFQPYFELWRHGVKVRILSDDRIDIYLPHVNR